MKQETHIQCAPSRVDLMLAEYLPRLEASLAKLLPEFIVEALIEFLVFGIKQACACLFGGLLLLGIILTANWSPEWGDLRRYDYLFIYAISIQIIFLLTKLERVSEAKVILIFHITGTVMEVFKTHMGSWVYPEESLFRIGSVPLFSGFMYAAVGSYLARVTRTFEFQFSAYPKKTYTIILASVIYINFFTHHYIFDIRNFLFLFCIVFFLKRRFIIKCGAGAIKCLSCLGFSLCRFLFGLRRISAR